MYHPHNANTRNQRNLQCFQLENHTEKIKRRKQFKSLRKQVNKVNKRIILESKSKQSRI
jgi:hypothetical protein